MEEWKDIEGYENRYQVSNMGNVKSISCGKNKLMKLKPDKDGYLTVCFRLDGKSRFYKVHRLVANAFIPNPEWKPQVDHINTIRTDNRVTNLRWVTPKENTGNPSTMKRIRRNSQSVNQYTLDGILIKTWQYASEASSALSITSSHIYDSCRKNTIAGGYHWRFVS